MKLSIWIVQLASTHCKNTKRLYSKLINFKHFKRREERLSV
jgi:hypothetical protein